MAVNTSSGSKLSIAGIHAPATDTAVEYAALTWVEIKEVENLGELGDQAAQVTFAAVGDRRVRKLKGANDAGDMTIVCGRDPADAGQIAMKAAQVLKYDYDFKLVGADTPNGVLSNSIWYFFGKIMSQRTAHGPNDNVVRTTFTIAINGDIIEVAPA